MFEELKGKKLLYLGGIPRAKYVVSRARKLGIYVIVADYDPNSPAKQVADEGVLVNAVDVDALESGYLDIMLPVLCELSKRLNLPCYMTDSMLKSATNKDYFKEMCNKYKVPVPQTYVLESESIDDSAKALPYPVFIKPLDSSGSRGADVCYNEEDFKKKYEYALSFSKQKIVTIEDFLEGTEFILDYMIVDGVPYLASMADRYVVEGRSKAINSPNLMVFPSKHLQRYKKDVEPAVCNMFRQEKFPAGVIFLQGYAGNKISFYETGCRLGGTWPYIDEYYHGINPMDMLFSHALTGKMLDEPSKGASISAEFKGKAAIIYFLANRKEDTIAKVKGLDEVEKLPYVVHVMEHHPEGEHYAMGTLTDVRFSAVHLVAETMEQLKERVKHIYSLVDYLDENGDSLLAPVYDVDQLEGYE